MTIVTKGNNTPADFAAINAKLSKWRQEARTKRVDAVYPLLPLYVRSRCEWLIHMEGAPAGSVKALAVEAWTHEELL